MRILLVQPDALPGVGFRTVALPEPLHLEMVAATVPDHDVRILDMRIDRDLDAALRAFWPEMVAVTALTPEVYAARHVLQQVKSFSSEIFTVVGGHHATLASEDFFVPQVDVVALGEAEVMFRELVRAVADRRGLRGVPNVLWQDHDGTFIRNTLSEDRFHLSELPLPRRDLTESYWNELLTDDYSCFDTLHAVLPTRLPREEFYQNFAELYRQRDIGPYYDLVQAGKMTIEDCRRGKAMLDTMADWERYIERDPVLGTRNRRRSDPLLPVSAS